MNERTAKELASPVAFLVTGVCVAAAVLVMATMEQTTAVLHEAPERVLMFAALALVLQYFSVPVHSGGYVGVAAIGILATGFVLGTGPAIAVAIISAATRWRPGKLAHRTVFDAAQFALSGGLGALVYHTLTDLVASDGTRIVAALAAGLVYTTINNGLLCWAMSLAETVPIRTVWRERFRWARLHYLAFGPLGLASAIAYEQIGLLGLLAFTLPSGLLLLSVREYVERTRALNVDLERSNADLRDLFEFTAGLAARAHDRGRLLDYASRHLEAITGVGVSLTDDPLPGATEIRAGDRCVGSLAFDELPAFDAERWLRLREALIPQLITAVEGASLVERVRAMHVNTIAALSRSIEAKDHYTGGHTERVAAISVALAKRLGYEGDDLDAVEIGALLHDVGKIGIPEHILRKAGPLEEHEWRVMKEHPVISDYILSEIDLPPIVREIARSSHERIDGTGYPDALAGDAIPLPARIVLGADAFDALTTDRAYRSARPVHAALQEIRAGAGTQFCTKVVAALEQVYREEPEVLGVEPLRAVG